LKKRSDVEWGPCDRCGHKASDHRTDEPSDRCMVAECRCLDYDATLPSASLAEEPHGT
jgi:hypothetical protein